MKLHPLVWMGVAFFVVCQPLSKGVDQFLETLVCAAAGQWQRSLLLLQACHREPWFSWFIMIKKKAMVRLVLVFRMKSKPVPLNTSQMEHCIGSSLHVWIGWCLPEVMEADGPFPSVVTYGSAVAALRRGGHWQHALQLLERAQDQKVREFFGRLRS